MRVESSVAVPIEQAQLIDPSSFRFDTSGAKSLGQAGAVLQELGKRKVGMQDKIAVSNTNAAMQKAQLDYQQEIIGKPLDQHASILQKHVNIAKSSSGGQRMSNDTRKLSENKLKIWGNTFTETGELVTIKALEKDALIRVTDDYENALTNGTPEDIQDAEDALNEQYKNSYTPAEAEQLKAKSEDRAVEQMRNNAVSEIQELAARTPNAVISRIEDEQELRKTKDAKDFPMLSSKDLEAARDYAKTIGEKAKDGSTQAKDQAVTDNYSAIAGGAVNINEMIQGIVNDPNISDEDKPSAIEKTRTFFSGWHSTEMADRKWPLTDDDRTVQGLETLLTAQRSGTKDIGEVNEQINTAANSSLLTKSTRDRFRDRSRKGGNDAIDDATNQYTSRVSNALVGRLTDREARFRAREATVGLTIDERRQASSAGFLLQVGKDQLSRFSIDLDSALREVKGGRETVSGTEANSIAALVWERFKGKSDATKIREFKEFTGASIPRPEGFSEDVWNTGTDEDRSNIVVAIEKGMSIEQVMEMIK